MNHVANAARAFRANLGWSWVGYLLGFTIVTISIVVLLHILQDIETREIVVALKRKSLQDLMLAALFVVLAYGTLTFYDLFALRTIGIHHIPYHFAAVASFVSYSIGHNIGATTFSAGAIRFRIYSAWGLQVVDVARICFITGLTFWLGNLTVLGFGMAFDPLPVSRINLLPLWANRAIGIATLCALAGYIAWVCRKPRSLGRRNWSITLPTGASTALQIAIGVVDLGCCAVAMYMLMPATPSIDFTTLAAVFVVATLLGFASHAPGSLGVFDAAMLVALPQFEKEDLIAGLLLFRLLYFVIPFSLALLLMAGRETFIALCGTGKSG